MWAVKFLLLFPRFFDDCFEAGVSQSRDPIVQANFVADHVVPSLVL